MIRKKKIIIEPNHIYHGDCLELMKELPDKSVDLVLTDPPYGSSGRDGSVHLNNDNLFGNRMSLGSLIWFVRMYSKELFRLLKHNSHCYIFSDWRKYKDIQIAFETSGWELRSLIIWDKGNGMGEYWRSCHEFILFFTKRSPKKLNYSCMNVLKFNLVRGKEKICGFQKPVELIKFLIEASSNENDLVLDPFIGSGTTAVACIRTKRNYVGMEIGKDIYNIVKKRIKRELFQSKFEIFK